MSIGSEAEAQSFAETRRTLLAALDRTEHEAHTQAAELVSAAERRARDITLKADQSAALIEEQLAYLTAQLDHVRARITDIRGRFAQEMQALADRRPPLARTAPQPPAGLAEAVYSVPVVTTPVAAAPLAADSGTADGNGDSLPETLRVLRAALESLNGEASNH